MTPTETITSMRQYIENGLPPGLEDVKTWAGALEAAMQEPAVTLSLVITGPGDGYTEITTHRALKYPIVLYTLPPDVTCPHIVTGTEGTSYCDLAESAMRERDAEIERLKADRDHERWLREQAEYVTEATRDQREELREETERLLDLLSEAADDLTDFINAEYPPAKRVYPSDRRRYDSDMEIVRKILAALAKEDKPNG